MSGVGDDRPKATPEELAKAKAVLQATRAVADAIKALGEVPSGHLYAHLMGKLDLAAYTRIIDILKSAKLVSEDGFHLLRWIGPKDAATKA